MCQASLATLREAPLNAELGRSTGRPLKGEVIKLGRWDHQCLGNEFKTAKILPNEFTLMAFIITGDTTEVTMFSTIIHPTDFSPATIPALKTAQSLAKTLQAKMVVFFIANPPQVASGNTLTNPDTHEKRDIASELEELLPCEPGVDRELRIVVAETSAGVKRILTYLEETEGDLVVLGMHKRSGVAGWFGPTITEEVVRKAAADVLVVKHHDGDAAAEVDDA